MCESIDKVGCGSREHVDRRSLLKLAGLSGLGWLTPLATSLARQHERREVDRSRSLIILWLQGAPSQLETFDPHPGTEIAAGSLARPTNRPGILLGDGFEQTAEQMDSLSLVRAITSKEGDHARALYNIKTGFRPDPTLLHPAIGSVICHQTRNHDGAVVDIPRHISILANRSAGRGGYLGEQFDAFKLGDPINPVPDLKPRVGDRQQARRLADLSLVDREFLRRQGFNRDLQGVLGNYNLEAALKMMSSEQVQAFDVSQADRSLREEYGDTPFGRGCLAAVRLIEKGVRCVEVTLNGWDTHVNNHELQAGRIKILDPALATLIRDLKRRDLLDSTMVVCGGEFGRTPWLNSLEGRDHWPSGFAMALAGGGIQGGRVVGETSPQPKRDAKDRTRELKNSHAVEDIHATILGSLGIELTRELDTPIGRPMPICEGKPIQELLD
ncbi:MAG: DUF1501 domain-containing protein [Mariniblastus sp.]|nr:DUF1501 domain-containing protein [Mariniblastus sp.]